MPCRKALLIGINYFGTKYQLNGCINDAMNIREYLVQNRGFSPSHHDMVLMTDAPENRGTPFEPTGANMMAVCFLIHNARVPLLTEILQAFQWLVSGNNPGDSVFLLYSGHGGRLCLERASLQSTSF